MDFEAFAAYGLPGLLVGAAVVIVLMVVKRGVRVKIEAEIPPKR